MTAGVDEGDAMYINALSCSDTSGTTEWVHAEVNILHWEGRATMKGKHHCQRLPAAVDNSPQRSYMQQTHDRGLQELG